MGKVGSSSIEAQIPNAFHTHTLYGKPPSRPYHELKFGKAIMFLRKITIYPAKRFLFRRAKNVKIVTFIRRPEERNPSMFFQDLPFFVTSYLLKSSSKNSLSRIEDPELLANVYANFFDLNYGANWLESELSRFTGISVDQFDLGHSDYKKLEGYNFQIFIGKIENLNRYISELSVFVGQPLNIDRLSNRASHKWYAPLYSDFKVSVRTLPTTKNNLDFKKRNGYIE